jgi:broad specificity phosphatase PhoE
MTPVAPGGRRRIYLLRHGQVPYFGRERAASAEEVSLSAAGREQATAAGKLLAGIPFDRVVTSGLRRTVETAELVLAAAGGATPEIEAWPELHEIKGGSVDEVPDEELDEVFLGLLRPPVSLDSAFLAGETLRELGERVVPAIERLLAERWQTLLLVAHGGVNRVVLSLALTGGRVLLGNLEQHPACINVLDVDPPGADGFRQWMVHAVNVTPTDLVTRDRRTTTMEDMLAEYRAARAAGHPPR